MAYDKVIDSTQLDGALTATANAIREKGGTTDVLPWNMETGFASAVSAIEAGGAALNFSVVAYASEDALPATAEENTIAVITSTEITSWFFGTTAPETPETGMVWFETAEESEVEFSAVLENVLMVYPKKATQYVSGSWVNVNAQTYKGGNWLPWILYLYDKGDECTGVTGGWVLPPTGEFTIATKGTGAFVFAKRQALSTAQKINLPNYSKLCVECTASNGTAPTGYIGRSLANVGLPDDMLGLLRPVNVGINKLDISSVNEKGHVSLYTYYDADNMTITRVWLE